jgi:hypothetical protein
MYLIKLEWLKFRKNIVLLLLALLYLILLPIKLFGGSAMEIQFPGFNNMMLVQFPTVWSFVGYIGNWLVFFFWGFAAIYLVTSEFANRTFRQNVISGLSRHQMFFAKFNFLLVLALIATIYYVLVCLLIGFSNYEDTEWSQVFERADLIPRYFLMCVGYMSLGLFLGLMVRKTAVAIFLYFTYIMFFELLLRWVIHKEIVNNKSMHFYPANAIEDLVPVPVKDFPPARQFIEANAFDFYLTPLEATITSLIYIILFLGLAYRSVQVRDL